MKRLLGLIIPLIGISGIQGPNLTSGTFDLPVSLLWDGAHILEWQEEQPDEFGLLDASDDFQRPHAVMISDLDNRDSERVSSDMPEIRLPPALIPGSSSMTLTSHYEGHSRIYVADVGGEV